MAAAGSTTADASGVPSVWRRSSPTTFEGRVPVVYGATISVYAVFSTSRRRHHGSLWVVLMYACVLFTTLTW